MIKNTRMHNIRVYIYIYIYRERERYTHTLASKHITHT